MLPIHGQVRAYECILLVEAALIQNLLMHTGGKENDEEMLRSILAQLEYSYQICKWDDGGVPFRTHMYVPEKHPLTEDGSEFHEREDFAHVLKVLFIFRLLSLANIIFLKRIAKSTRLGGPDKLQLDRFTEALYDEDSGLTYPALTGQRKQSVRDAENFFSKGVEEFMRKKGYTYEEKFVRCVRNWRRACDERGLSSLQRCRFNYDLLNLICPYNWYRECGMEA